MFNYGKTSDASVQRLYRALTDKGLREFREHIEAGLTPRQSIRKIRDECRISSAESAERQKQIFIQYCSEAVKLSVEDYIKGICEEFRGRLESYTEKKQAEIIKNWGAKSIDEAIANYTKKSIENWDKDKTNVFRERHIRNIEEAIFYGLPYNQEAYERYKDEIKELVLPKHSSCLEYKD